MKRKPFQGVGTVVRFNWHFFAIGGAAIVTCAAGGWWLPVPFSHFAWAVGALVATGIATSLAATAWAYDFTGFYQLHWLDAAMNNIESAANIHAGFDETTAWLRHRYPIRWYVCDFYDPQNHSEISIRRARAVAAPDRETIPITTACVPLPEASLDLVLLILSAHEIRDAVERVVFFRELRRIVKPGGRLIVAEHTRDLPNTLAYGLGAWHFHTRAAWLATFRDAAWVVEDERRVNRFITSFTLT